MRSDQEAESVIKFLIDNNLAATYFDPKKKEQMIDITEFGKDVNDILNHMRTDL